MGAHEVQEFIHKLDSGTSVKWMRRVLLFVAILYVANLWLFREGGFRGLSHKAAIDQAQIAREVARGHGFATKWMRPLAIAQFDANKGDVPPEPWPDTIHAPLNPLVNSLFLLLVRSGWEMSTRDAVYVCDRVLASVQLGFYLLAVLVSYFTASRLFDRRLATLGAGLLLLCEAFWEFSMSGLPQMLMLFLFSVAANLMLRALEASGAGRPTLRWSAAIGLVLGLLALTHPLTAFVAAGAIFFAAIIFRPWGRDATVMLLVCAAVVSPWLCRNYAVCGNPLGLAGTTIFTNIAGSENRIMRSSSFDELHLSAWPLFEKIEAGLLDQSAQLYAGFGSVLAAPVFFIALLHRFRVRETSLFRWWVLTMWIFAVLGMCVFGLEQLDPVNDPATVRANDLHVLFVPLMTFYGLAFLLVLWSRLEVEVRLLRIAFLAAIFLLSAIPFLTKLVELHRGSAKRVHWPPYVPPYIAILKGWTEPGEVIMSDMPWAVAWYADRKSLWLPMSLDEFNTLNDYQRLGAPIVGLYLTPFSGNAPFLSGLATGDYKGWGRVITRQPKIESFPLRSSIPLPIDGHAIFFADRPRWKDEKGSGSNVAPSPSDSKPPGRRDDADEKPLVPPTRTPAKTPPPSSD